MPRNPMTTRPRKSPARVAAGKRNGPLGGRPKGESPPTRQIRVYEHDAAELTAEARRRSTTTAQVVAELRAKPHQKSCP